MESANLACAAKEGKKYDEDYEDGGPRLQPLVAPPGLPTDFRPGLEGVMSAVLSVIVLVPKHVILY